MGEKIAMRSSEGQPVASPRQGVPPPAAAASTSQKFPRIGSIDDVRVEMDHAITDARQYYQWEPDEVMRSVSGHLARLVEISQEIRRIEGSARQWKPVRTNEIDPLMKDLWDQFQIHSRLQSVREMDFRVSGMNG